MQTETAEECSAWVDELSQFLGNFVSELYATRVFFFIYEWSSGKEKARRSLSLAAPWAIDVRSCYCSALLFGLVRAYFLMDIESRDEQQLGASQGTRIGRVVIICAISLLLWMTLFLLPALNCRCSQDKESCRMCKRSCSVKSCNIS